jgi:hypothetical protein
MMPWKCPQDGTDVPDSANTCALCGYVRIPSGIALRSDASGKEVQVRLGVTLGGSALRLLDDPDLKYVSSEQFKLEKRQEQGGWAILNVAYAANPAYLNGAPIADGGAILKEGDRLSIKDKFFRLTVRLLA